MQINIHSKSKASDLSATTTSMLIDFSKRNFAFDPYLTSQITKLTSNNKLVTEAIKEKDVQSELGAFDERRDEALRVIFLEVKAKEHWHDKSISDAAVRLGEELDKYGFETIKLAYADESASINALLLDLKEPDVVVAISKLPGFDGLISRLHESQEEFESAFIQFVSKKIEKRKILSATRLSKLICKQVNEEIMVYLSGIALAKPELYKECLDVLEKIIEINNSKVRNRLKKSRPEEEPLAS